MGSIAYLQKANNVTTQTTYTFSSQNLGAEAVDRYIIVAIATRKSGISGNVSSVTVGGETAVIVGQISNTEGSNNSTTALAIALVTTGTTEDVVVTMSEAFLRMGIAVYRATGLASATPHDSGTSTATAPTTNLDLPAAGGFMLGVSKIAAAGTCTWTELVEDFDDNFQTYTSYSGAHKEYLSSQTNKTVTATWSSSNSPGGVFASWAYSSDTTTTSSSSSTSSTSTSSTSSSSSTSSTSSSSSTSTTSTSSSTSSTSSSISTSTSSTSSSTSSTSSSTSSTSSSSSTSSTSSSTSSTSSSSSTSTTTTLPATTTSTSSTSSSSSTSTTSTSSSTSTTSSSSSTSSTSSSTSSTSSSSSTSSTSSSTSTSSTSSSTSSTSSSSSTSSTSSSSSTSSTSSSTSTTSTSSSTSSTSSSSSTSSTSTSTSTSTTTTLQYTGCLAFGEQNPTDGETPISWATWAGTGVIIGDINWGKLELNGGETQYSKVYDHGSAVLRQYQLTQNKYGTGQGSAVIQYRGSTTAFLATDLTPTWNTYTGVFDATYRYIQIKGNG